MRFPAPVEHAVRPRARYRPGATAPFPELLRRCFLLLLGVVVAVTLGLAGSAARAAEQIELTALDLTRDEDGVHLSYAADLELSRSVEDALNKGVPLFFVAEAQVFRDRWYWRDRRVADVVRVWRIVYQPLTSTYRVTFGALTQTFATRSEALAAITRASRWKIAEPGQIEEGSRHYVEFSFKLDTSLLPRPMQIGVAGQPDWQISVTRTLRLN
jgi:hypothetical protein